MGEDKKVMVFDWERTVVMTRRYFHDDWKKIIDKLKEQLDISVSFKPFHAEKALIIFEEKRQATLQKQRGWTTVGNFYVKFEEWNLKTHATPRLLPSYVAG